MHADRTSRQAYLASRTWKDFKIVEAVSDAVENVYSAKTTVKNDGNNIVVSNVASGFHTATLYDLMGRKISEAAMQSGRARIDATGIPSGIYAVTLRGTQGSCSMKLTRD